MIVPALIAVLLFLTPVAGTPASEEQGLFVEFGTEHCAEETAVVIYENLLDTDDELTVDTRDYIAYSAYEFASAEAAYEALDDAPMFVAQRFSVGDDLDRDTLEEFIAETPTEDYGDRTVAYTMNLPTSADGEEVLFVDMLGTIKENQLVMILLFSDSGVSHAAPGLTAGDPAPFAESLDEPWDGVGDIEDALPHEENVPVGWDAADVLVQELPAC